MRRLLLLIWVMMVERKKCSLWCCLKITNIVSINPAFLSLLSPYHMHAYKVSHPEEIEGVFVYVCCFTYIKISAQHLCICFCPHGSKKISKKNNIESKEREKKQLGHPIQTPSEEDQARRWKDKGPVHTRVPNSKTRLEGDHALSVTPWPSRLVTCRGFEDLETGEFSICIKESLSLYSFFFFFSHFCAMVILS